MDLAASSGDQADQDGRLRGDVQAGRDPVPGEWLLPGELPRQQAEHRHRALRPGVLTWPSWARSESAMSELGSAITPA